jgi:hypothetical protein
MTVLLFILAVIAGTILWTMMGIWLFTVRSDTTDRSGEG